MRTHFLNRLKISGREAVLQCLPNFDFYNLSRVLQLWITVDYDGSSAELFLVAAYDPQGSVKPVEVTLRFSKVKNAKLPELSPFCFLSELEIEDVGDNQLDGIRYHAKNYGSTEFEVSCEAISIQIGRR